MSAGPGERLDLTSMFGDVELPCDARRHTGDDPAVWIVWTNPCCPARPACALSCDECLRRTLISERPVRCRSCGHRDIPRHWINRFERIKKPPAVA